MAFTYWAGTQYTQYLEASVGPNCRPCNAEHADYRIYDYVQTTSANAIT